MSYSVLIKLLFESDPDKNRDKRFTQFCKNKIGSLLISPLQILHLEHRLLAFQLVAVQLDLVLLEHTLLL